ncbi:MAG: hypothetical protein AB7D36_00295 [Oscillospiraceae bacterium]
MRSRLLQLGNAFALIAVCCYIALAAAPLFMQGRRTASAYERTVRETCPVTGIFLRSEYVLPYAKGVFPEAYEGKHISAGGELGGISSPVSGTFTVNLDGYEHISAPKKLAPLEVRALTGDRRVATASAGKIITDAVWQFAAVLETDAVQKLHVGGCYQLETDYWAGVTLTLVRIGERWEDFTAVLFEGSGDMDKILYLREVNAVLMLGEYSGLSIPDAALHEDSEGYYTNVLTLGKSQRAEIEPVYYGEDFVLVTSGELWDGSEILLADETIDLEAQK